MSRPDRCAHHARPAWPDRPDRLRRSPHPVRPDRALLPDLRAALEAADLRLELLGGDGTVATVDTLALELVARMSEARWDAGAAPTVITSVLAASVPDAEAVLLRAAGFGGA